MLKLIRIFSAVSFPLPNANNI